jgi:hypothetical protein
MVTILRRSSTKVWLTLALAVAAAAVPATASAALGPYCGALVPAHTDCATNPGEPGDWWNGVFYINIASYTGGGSASVCEHTYLRSNGATVSDRCRVNYSPSEADLYEYHAKKQELSGHAGNNSEHTHTIYGTVEY